MVSHLFFPTMRVSRPNRLTGLPCVKDIWLFSSDKATVNSQDSRPWPWMALWFDSLRKGKIGQNMSSQLECSDWPTQIKHHDVNLIQCIIEKTPKSSTEWVGERVCLSQPVDLGFPASWKAARIFGCSFDQQISGSARRNGRLRGWRGTGLERSWASEHALTILNPCNFHSFYMTTSWEGLAIVWSQLVGSCLFVCLSVCLFVCFFFSLSLSLAPPLPPYTIYPVTRICLEEWFVETIDNNNSRSRIALHASISLCCCKKKTDEVQGWLVPNPLYSALSIKKHYSVLEPS